MCALTGNVPAQCRAPHQMRCVARGLDRVARLEQFLVAVGKVLPHHLHPEPQDEALEKKVYDMTYEKVYAIAKAGSSKHERSEAFGNIKDEVLESFSEEELEEVGDLVKKLKAKDLLNGAMETKFWNMN